jgi:hypothetical protein
MAKKMLDNPSKVPAEQVSLLSYEEGLVEQLLHELASQRAMNIQLSQEVAEEKQRNLQLEVCLSNLRTVPRVTSWGSLEDSFPRISSLESIADILAPECSIPRTGSYNSLSTTAEVQWTSVPRVESWSSLTSACLADASPQPATVGVYPPHIRQLKIRTYKEKQRRYREKYNVSRVFNGRSKAAKNKLRVNGRFVKADSV